MECWYFHLGFIRNYLAARRKKRCKGKSIYSLKYSIWSKWNWNSENLKDIQLLIKNKHVRLVMYLCVTNAQVSDIFTDLDHPSICWVLLPYKEWLMQGAVSWHYQRTPYVGNSAQLCLCDVRKWISASKDIQINQTCQGWKKLQGWLWKKGGCLLYTSDAADE